MHSPTYPFGGGLKIETYFVATELFSFRKHFRNVMPFLKNYPRCRDLICGVSVLVRTLPQAQPPIVRGQLLAPLSALHRKSLVPWKNFR